MRHSEEKYSEHSATSEESRHRATQTEDIDKSWADTLNEACKKPIMKQLPFCADEPPPIP
jgi:hypothetical protein